MEVRSETDYCAHHIQKVVAFFKAMREFASELKKRGFKVHYIPLDAKDNEQSLSRNIIKLSSSGRYSSFQYQMPDEMRVDAELQALAEKLSIPTQQYDTEHFYTSRNEVAELFKGKKQCLMESFYRRMRVKHDVLMEGADPVGGQWNFDAENRKRIPLKHPIPEPPSFTSDVSSLVAMIKRCGVRTIGEVNPKAFEWGTTRTEALKLLDHFCTKLLPSFGTYQDAMTEEHDTLFHSQLSFSINVKLISPKEVVERAIQEFHRSKGAISLPQIEGFVRQILGWREYMRGMYWALMPKLSTDNFLKHTRPLPEFYWSGKTKMKCVSHAVTQSLRTGYAHHIQRLMITGNFALLAGIDPAEIDAWYLGIYCDAIEWVQLPNTRGMSQFADGGKIATKPYVSSANYINKMSHYCSGCWYDKEKRVGDKACPFNSLYWNFFITHRDKLEKNPRIGMAYRNIDRMSETDIKEVRKQAAAYLKNLNDL
jgi:deoxyribodipyrimidine photolyase-related protein